MSLSILNRALTHTPDYVPPYYLSNIVAGSINSLHPLLPEFSRRCVTTSAVSTSFAESRSPSCSREGEATILAFPGENYRGRAISLRILFRLESRRTDNGPTPPPLLGRLVSFPSTPRKRENEEVHCPRPFSPTSGSRSVTTLSQSVSQSVSRSVSRRNQTGCRPTEHGNTITTGGGTLCLAALSAITRRPPSLLALLFSLLPPVMTFDCAPPTDIRLNKQH